MNWLRRFESFVNRISRNVGAVEEDTPAPDKDNIGPAREINEDRILLEKFINDLYAETHIGKKFNVCKTYDEYIIYTESGSRYKMEEYRSIVAKLYTFTRESPTPSIVQGNLFGPPEVIVKAPDTYEDFGIADYDKSFDIALKFEELWENLPYYDEDEHAEEVEEVFSKPWDQLTLELDRITE